MSTPTKLVVGVAGGYLLGRRKKMKLAITLGSMLAGQKIAIEQPMSVTTSSTLHKAAPAKPRPAARSARRTRG